MKSKILLLKSCIWPILCKKTLTVFQISEFWGKFQENFMWIYDSCKSILGKSLIFTEILALEHFVGWVLVLCLVLMESLTKINIRDIVVTWWHFKGAISWWYSIVYKGWNFKENNPAMQRVNVTISSNIMFNNNGFIDQIKLIVSSTVENVKRKLD